MGRDYFSRQAHSYFRYRPSYPLGLFEFLSGHLKSGDLIWDCATGNGQAAVCFDRRFNVIATDQSMAQLINRSSADNVLFI